VYPTTGGDADPNSDPGVLARAQAAGQALFQRDPIRPVPDYYADPSDMPGETPGAQFMKNLARAYSAAAAPPVHIPDLDGGNGIDFDMAGMIPHIPAMGTMGAMGDLEKSFAGSRMGKLVGDVKPWEMHPDDWVRHMRDNLDPNFLARLKAIQESMGNTSFPQGYNPQQIYSELTGARAIDVAGSADPQKVNSNLAKLAGIEAPGLTQVDQLPWTPRNYRGVNGPPSVRWPGQQFPHMPFYGGYSPEGNQSVLVSGPHKIMYPQGDQENLLASTVAHELEHASDYQNGLFRQKTGFEQYLEQNDPRYSNPETTVREIDAGSLPRGPQLWANLTEPRANLLKSYGQVDGAPSRFAPARTPNNQYSMNYLDAQNPRAVQRIGSLGHFATLDNFETDWALKNLTKQALSEGRDVNPAILDAFPDLRNPQPQRGQYIDMDRLLQQVRPQK